MRSAHAAAIAIATIASAQAPSRSPIRFESGPTLGFVLANNPTAVKYLPETMAGGMAAFDYNNDGRPDLFFANGAELPGFRKTGAKHWNRLYRNDGGFRFTDVTEAAGLAGEGFAFGAAVADYDGDGHLDIFVPALPRSRLYRNRGNGSFEDATARAAIGAGPWTVAAGWFDFDRDGRPDLFLVNYLEWSVDRNPWCGDRARNLRVYCHPNQFQPTRNQLLRNRGDGTFEDVSGKSGIAAHPGKGMSVAFADYDGDGFPDIFVTNDALPNFLFRNRGGGVFEEAAFDAGAALPDRGLAVSGMGADFRDYDNDGRPDIVFTALAGETFPLFRNVGKGMFEEATQTSRLRALSVRLSGWCVALADFDNDGLKDIFTANSHVNDRIAEVSSDGYVRPNSVFRNRDGRTFDDATAFSPAMGSDAHAHRGCAVADLDGDGRLDVAVTALNSPAEIWRNSTGSGAHWIGLDLGGNPGAVVRIGNQTNLHSSSVGYSSSSFGPVHHGLGEFAGPVEADVIWPDGSRQSFPGLQIDRIHKLRKHSSR